MMIVYLDNEGNELLSKTIPKIYFIQCLLGVESGTHQLEHVDGPVDR